MLGKKYVVAEIFLHHDSGQRRQRPGVGSRPHAQVNVGHLGGVGDHRVDDDHRALRVLGDLVEHRSCPRETLRHPRVLADEHRHFGVLEFPSGVAAVEVGVDPGLTRLLLRERIGAVVRAECLQEGTAVCATEMVALPAATVVEDLVAAVGVGDASEAGRNLDNGRVPVDLLVVTVWPSAHRRSQPAAVVLIVVQAQRLVAGVSLGRRMFLVPADLCQLAAV